MSSFIFSFISYRMTPMNSVEPSNSYISLFSSGGIGDLGFHDEGFFCVASAELISRRIEVQRINDIAEPHRLICGDLLLPGPFNSVLKLAEDYEKEHRQPITVIMATPPCQGMSVANHKKGDELRRNSLVVRSIEMIRRVRPLVFLFENVPAFMKTTCTGLDGHNRPIGEEINKELGANYEYYSRVLQLSDFGSPSSRKRSLTIGVRNDVTWVTPLDLFPDKKTAIPLRDLIGDLQPLNVMGECSSSDILHSFRPYEKRMRNWIRDLKEGESAFDNIDPMKRPHRLVDGKIVPNVRKNGDKYRRVPWSSVPPCVHTRNDILASQNTIHPVDDRVFSIRELMRMMGVRDDFIWYEDQEKDSKLRDNSRLRTHAVNIRQCLGEAVPVPVTQSVAQHVRIHLTQHLRFSAARPCRSNSSDWTTESQKRAYYNVPLSRKKTYAAYYTEPLVAFAITKRALEQVNLNPKDTFHVLEPSAGSGVFIAVLNSFAAFNKISVTAIEIEKEMADYLRDTLTGHSNLQKIDVKHVNYLSYSTKERYHLILGNPPFGRRPKDTNNNWNKDSELSVRFLKKGMSEASLVAFVMPKALLHAAYYSDVRSSIMRVATINNLLDFGEHTFPDVKVETIGIIVNDNRSNSPTNDVTEVKSWPLKQVHFVDSNYIFDDTFPTWVIYRTEEFDAQLSRVNVGKLKVWRDRKVSRKMASPEGVRVIRGRNLKSNGTIVTDARDYLVPTEIAESVIASVTSLPGSSKFLAPNLSYKPRAVKIEKIRHSVPEGSCAVLYGDLTSKESSAFVAFAGTKQFESFYRIACNYSTRSINIDSCLAYWWAVPKVEDTTN
ncbi:DNA cytosine methyltransferase [Actinotignum sanguinis]|uniref:DNA (cytosine-5-)-methyltransferase n=3 Tax=Bacillati TaxID=1783272 RepID=A0ABZ0RCB5_9ACTO|nr:DNA cytosine methyltransferase [Actinotignum sanguinis]WPJ88695.1 DNA cytosine methyltransferase [Schaalia turicensis]MDE1553192.1 DNA cytosine methyltransferase [Actinotignum sanguinis]MDE1566399.1 DNA cytosine methyltransferase [Actinotignum sanguinis]MDE1576939.1 DNA cytosine methyltransferase [Actinotignum sanguinis]MDE1641982.1 DNA cytosine methyltransferase [Actinotignum sanguinis]